MAAHSAGVYDGVGVCFEPGNVSVVHLITLQSHDSRILGIRRFGEHAISTKVLPFFHYNTKSMKAISLLVFAISFTLQGIAQNEWYYFPDEIYFVKEVPAKEFRGKHFRYQIAVKANAADTFSKVRINGVGVGKGPDDFLNNSNFTKGYHKESDWTIYTITGTVPEEAWKLWFYSAVNGNGEFYFDNISFTVEVEGEWMEIELPNASFEQSNKNIFNGYYVSSRKTPHLKARITQDAAFHGDHSLHISTSGLIPTSPKSLTRQ
jgi:hypothetical protein